MVYDVCVIGSGLAGGVLSKELAEAGAKVALVEAGRMMTGEDFHYHAWPYQRPYARRLDLYGPRSAYPAEVTKAIRYENSDRISVDRIRAVGGRSIHWNAVCLRFADRDFREWRLQGVEEDWPLTYQELSPFYSHVEKMIGVTGMRDHLEIVPDGEYLRPLKGRCSDQIIKRTCGKLGIPVIAARKAVLTEPYDDRPPCHYCGHCMDGCDVGAIFSVPDSMLPKAQRTGKFTLMPNKVARELLVDQEGKLRAVSLVDTVTRREQKLQARAFAVCCGAIESPRLLLNSRSPRFPNGLANSSDVVGRYLSGHVTAAVFGYLEELVGTSSVNNDGATDHFSIPRFNVNRKRLGYAGGFQYQVQDMPFMYPFHAPYCKGFGKGFKKQVRLLQPGFIWLDCYGKVLGRPENRITVDSARPDAYGIPIPVVHFRFAENDRAVWRDMKQNAREILEAAKCRMVVNDNPEPGGFASHETGTVRMGIDPRTSVLNGYCQARDVKNLFVVDGSCFTTFPEKNPTLTIMALAVRTAAYIMKEAKFGRL